MSRRRGSTMTEVSLRLSEDVVDDHGVYRLSPIAPGPSNDNSDIAPWLDVPPTPPPKSPLRTFAFSSKVSVNTLGPPRQGSYSHSYGSRSPYAESQSTLSVPPDSGRMSVDGDGESSTRGMVYSGSSTHSGDHIRKSKSSMTLATIGRKILRRPSKPSLAFTNDGIPPSEHSSLRQPEPPLPTTLNMGGANGSLLSINLVPFKATKEKKHSKGKRKESDQQLAPAPPEKDPLSDGLHTIDLSIDPEDMVGILDPRVRASSNGHDFSSPGSGSGSDYGNLHPSSSIFDHNFTFAQPSVWPRKADNTRISPKTPIPPHKLTHRSIHSIGSDRPTEESEGSQQPASWVPPESWAVEGPHEPVMEPILMDSSSEESADEGPQQRPSVVSLSKPPQPRPPTDRGSKLKPRSRNKGKDDRYYLKIYRSDGAWHVIGLNLGCTVLDLNGSMSTKLLQEAEKKEKHRLYLDEGGRERLLNQVERPAHIIRRKLKLAGYEPVDGLEYMVNEDLNFLFKFIYKSQLLGPPEEDINFESFDFVDLTGRSLRTIPVILHQNADSIVSLKLSRNPMLDIPLDFIQSCSLLRDLRLSNMAMIKVPTSVVASTTLHRLDLSSNRIKDLSDTFLDRIPSLLNLSVKNNRLKSLPWHFARLRTVTTLNISNNYFEAFPKEILNMENLRSLDLSFNAIEVLPDELGSLVNLESLLLVGNKITRFPDDASKLVNLNFLDCRRNWVSDLTVVLMLPNIKKISADHNSIIALDLSIGPNMKVLDVSHNEITQLSLVPGPVGRSPYSLTELDLSYAKLSSLDDLALGTLISLQCLRLDHNAFRAIPETLGELSWLETLSCTDNRLDKLPESIGRLQKLETLDAHNNDLTELPQSLWNCASLSKINVTSNFIKGWPDPPRYADAYDDPACPPEQARKGSLASTSSTHHLPPLVHSLEKLYLAENRLQEDTILPLMIFKELLVLNLSFNDLQELPSMFFRRMLQLEELYLSGNKLTSIPTEDLYRMKRLSKLYLNGNRLQTLPVELGNVKDLTILDVGSNNLKYNINNWEFDWNWNFNKKLKYLNLSGNNRMQIKAESSRTSSSHQRMSKDLTSLGRQSMAGFKELTSLRVLGLMDVTITTTGSSTSVEIPEDSDWRRVRTSLSTVSGMGYGIADSLGQRSEALTMLDLVYQYPVRSGEPSRSVFGMFGRSHHLPVLHPGTNPNKLARFIHDSFVKTFNGQLGQSKYRGTIRDVMRRTFLKLNQQLWVYIQSLKRRLSKAANGSNASSSGYNSIGFDPGWFKSGVTAVVVYIVDKSVIAANVGDALAVVSRQGTAHCLSKKHDPYDRDETAHIRAAEGYVSSNGLVSDEVDVSRSFGIFNHVPVVTASPHIQQWNLSDLDEFIIIANNGLWDYVPYQTAVDIANTVARTDPMIAAQKLRDFAISYGADGSVMIMVIMVRDLFKSRQNPLTDILVPPKPRKYPEEKNKDTSRLPPEIDPPTGHLAIVFTDIRNSTHLWEVNPGMPMAMRLHNTLMRRQLRLCGGYEVKTEGDAFMVSFPTVLAALHWCLTIQVELLKEAWPLEILECEDGKDHTDANGRLIARGLSVRMGIHSGLPLCEPDHITGRMDYFGPMVNRAARISGQAEGGQITVSGDILREINASIFGTEPETEYSKFQSMDTIKAIKEIGVKVIEIGEVKLKGLEFMEALSVIYPDGLEARHGLKPPRSSTGSNSRVQFSVPQTKELGLLCLRLEALSSGRLFRTPPVMRKGSIASQTTPMENGMKSPTQGLSDPENPTDEPSGTEYLTADPELLLPPITDHSSDADLMLVLDSLSARIENAINALATRFCPPTVDKNKFMDMLFNTGELDQKTLELLSSMLQRM